MPGWKLSRTLWPAVFLLVALFFFFENTSVDLWLQDFFFNFSTGSWLVDKDALGLKWIFYKGAKGVIIVFTLSLLILALGPRRWREHFNIPEPARARLLVVVLSVIITPTLIGQIKHYTWVACPWDIQRYGGDLPYLKVMEPYPPGTRPEVLIASFPAAHPSGGFALLALAGLAVTRRRQLLGIAAGLGMGGIMGLYQMAKGAHYLSHVLISALLCWIMFLILHRLVVRRSP